MARRDSIQDEEKRSYGALWLVLSLLLLVTGVWALVDDNFFRRPWKSYQATFNRIEISRTEDAIGAEQQRLDADPAYQEATKKLATAEESLQSGDAAKQIAALDQELQNSKLDDISKDLDVRFIKSLLEEKRYEYDHAKQEGHPTEHILEQIQAWEKERAQRQEIYAASQANIAAIEQKIEDAKSQVEVAQEEVDKLTTTRRDLEDKLTQVSLGYLPGPKASPPFFGYAWQPLIPGIAQVVLEGFDLNAYKQPVARVDRCTSCHAGIAKTGFDDLENPMKSHPKRELYLGKHPPEQFGCTACHNGDGVAVNSVKYAHCNYYEHDGQLHPVHLRETLSLFRGEMMQTNCIKCHSDVQGLEGGEVIARGEKLFIEMGCHGCHLSEGYEDLARTNDIPAIGPSLRRIGAKVNPAWLVKWVTNPQAVRPRTRMPNFMFTEEQATDIAAYLLFTSGDPSKEWTAANADPAITVAPADVEQGEKLVGSLGCRGCHALAADEIAGQVGANKNIAPNLSDIASKTDARWMYYWIKNPHAYSKVARMPSLRLTDAEAKSITAYLSTLGTPTPVPAELPKTLADPERIGNGEKLVRKYGCAGCHEIPGMEGESRIGAELSTFGDKIPDELFFGDRTDLPHTWDDWTFYKIKEPRGYATEWIEQLMPQFNLADEDIKALRVFLRSRTELVVPPKWRDNSQWAKPEVVGERLVAKYNCRGCHQIDGRGGDIRRLYETNPASAPPILIGEGAKVQAPWLFNFLLQPTPIRPWLQVRMPTFGFSNEEANQLVQYFDATSEVKVPFAHVTAASFPQPMIEAGEKLASVDYFSCWSCHMRGTTKPEGEPDSWAPDLVLAAHRLKPDWVVEWITDPSKLMPGTKMPQFYVDPENNEGPEDILGGNDQEQIEALRDYIMSLGVAKSGAAGEGGMVAAPSPAPETDAAPEPE